MKEYKLKTYEGYHNRILVTDEFVAKNKFHLSKTKEELLERIEKYNEKLFDNSLEILVNYLEYEDAKNFYNDEYKSKIEKGEVTPESAITDVKETVQDMLDYLIFGYMKALDERGLSASRTINKLGIWFWLLGREDLQILVNDDDLYNPYGMPALIAVTEAMGLPVPDDVREFANKKYTD